MKRSIIMVRRTVEFSPVDDKEIQELVECGHYVTTSEAYRAAVSRGIRMIKQEMAAVA
jgi:Arc/MetJ-type ribon-helix-helix transcriptional regulator